MTYSPPCVSTSPKPHDSDGFTFVELIVGLAIVVMLAAVITPSVTGTLDRARVRHGADMLGALSATFREYYLDINDNPGQLSHLTGAITTLMVNSCGTLYDAGDVTQWDGPYYQGRVFVSSGAIPVFVGTARDNLIRVPALADPAVLGIVVDRVRQEDVLALDSDIDGGNGSLAGTIQWGLPDLEGLYTMTYYTPVQGC